MKNILLLLILALLFSLNSFGQSSNLDNTIYNNTSSDSTKEKKEKKEIFYKIEKKVEEDSTYLNLYIIPSLTSEIFEHSTFQFPSLKKNAIANNISYAYSYDLFFYEKDTIIPLLIKRIETIIYPERIFKRGKDSVETRIEAIFKASDFAKLDNISLLKVVKIIEDNYQKKEPTLKLNTSRKSNKNIYDNTVYLDFAEINNNHRYDGSYSQEKDLTFGLNRAHSTNRPPWYIELSFTRVSFSHDIFSEGSAIGFNGFGFEFGFQKDKVLNLSEFQNPLFTMGLQSLLGFKDKVTGLKDNFFVDLKLLLMLRLDTKKLAENLNFPPVIYFNKPLLNKTRGLAVDLHLVKAFNKLPFVNFYMYKGVTDFADPYVKFNTAGREFSYYSLNQWEGSMSFYWNGDGKKINKFKLDLGMGAYDIFKVDYGRQGSVINRSRVKNLSPIPLISIDYIHSSDDAKFGSSVRFFDKRVDFGVWLKIIKIGFHEVRLENNYISKRMWGTNKAWEHYDGNMINVKYRYGL